MMRVSYKNGILFLYFCMSSSFLYSNPLYDFRSQGINLARDLAGLQVFIGDCATRNCGDTSKRGFVVITPSYTESFSNDRLARYLFGSSIQTDCTKPVITIQGSLVQGRKSNAWLADYFGLPPDFNGSLFVNPHIRTFLIDLAAYIDCAAVAEGLYLNIHAPLVFTRWDLGLREWSVKGESGYPVGYFNAIPTAGPEIFRGATNSELLSTALDFLAKGQVPNLGAATTMHALCCSRFSCDTRKKIGVADIQATAGWNFACSADYHLGISLQVSVPTGNKPNPTIFFDPIIGSGGHWKLGAGVHGHIDLWKNKNQTAALGLYIDGYGQHLFGTNQKRCFDICGKPNSRYMLAMRLADDRGTPALVKPCDTGIEFQNEYAPVANLTQTSVDVSVAVEGDLITTLVYKTDCSTVTVGYNYWAHTCDRVFQKKRCCLLPLETKRWALKGDAQVIGFEENTNNPVRLAATESAATITSGTNHYEPGRIRDNPSIDNPCSAMTSSESVVVAPTSTDGTKSSNPSVLLNYTDINFSGTQGSSNKIFMHVDYAWDWGDRISGRLGIGGEIEFTNQDVCHNDCNRGCLMVCDGCPAPGSCEFSALNQWGLWMKGSIYFD